jgi:hypothetical protein
MGCKAGREVPSTWEVQQQYFRPDAPKVDPRSAGRSGGTNFALATVAQRNLTQGGATKDLRKDGRQRGADVTMIEERARRLVVSRSAWRELGQGRGHLMVFVFIEKHCSGFGRLKHMQCIQRGTSDWSWTESQRKPQPPAFAGPLVRCQTNQALPSGWVTREPSASAILDGNNGPGS